MDSICAGDARCPLRVPLSGERVPGDAKPQHVPLIALGTGAAYAFSVFALLFPGLLPESMTHHGDVPVYFEAAAFIVVLVLLGQVLELRARAGTGEAIRALLGLTPNLAHRVKEGAEEDVALELVHAGDVLRVKPGEKIPVDGTVSTVALR